MKNITTFIFCFLCVFQVKGQQDALYSQYMQNPLIINPAYTGTYDMFTATMISRWQWVGMQGAPNTNTFSAHSSIVNNKLGAGVIVSNDRFGISSNTEAHGTLAYKIKFSEKKENVLSFGMQVGVVNHSFDNGELTRKYEDDPNFLTGRRAVTEPNFGAGLFYRNEKLFAGFSIPKILNSKFEEGYASADQYSRHYFLTGGYLFDLNNVQIKPSFLLKYVGGAPVSVDLNTSVLLKDVLWLGLSIRNLNSTVVMAQVQLTDIFRLGYSLDLPLNKLIRTTYGSHELMLNVDLKLLKSHNIGLRYF